MKVVSCGLFLLALCSVQSTTVFNKGLDEQWENFKRVFGKHYSEQEEIARRLIWEGNVADIVGHNLEYEFGSHSYRKGLNEFADMSHTEFVKTFNGYKRSKTNKSSITYVTPSNLPLPDSVDWRKEGLVAPVKNQGLIGTCWPYSTTGSVEGQHKKKTGKLVSLSEQNLVDCCNGCFYVNQGFQYIIDNGGIDTEESYTSKNGTCNYNPATRGATIKSYVGIPSGEESELQKAVATIGPVSVAIDASQLSFQLYSGGVYDEPNCSSLELDHAVLVIGYGSEGGKDFWLVKNSWGTSWGENGYIKMARNKSNLCGIATDASYPLA